MFENNTPIILENMDFWDYMEPNPYAMKIFPTENDKENGNKVEDHLYISSVNTAHNMDFMSSNQIIAIVNITTDCPNKFINSIIYHNIRIEDDHHIDIIFHLKPAVTFINKYISTGQNVLVHCSAGKSRSASICIAYLMWKHQWHYDEAYKYLKSKRYIIEPNEKFAKQLIDNQKEILNYQL